MATADEIRKWQIGVGKTTGDTGQGALFFQLPKQPSDVPGMDYLRCAGEQRVIVETEIAAQLAELNATMHDLVDVIRTKRVTPRLGPRRRR